MKSEMSVLVEIPKKLPVDVFALKFQFTVRSKEPSILFSVGEQAII